ncbi:hypothetical protein HY993_01995 [Candidatus Micrarchaeota archaeon]|nr:hypothetical protein [Candidatus Micrarchaeota archaeon]
MPKKIFPVLLAVCALGLLPASANAALSSEQAQNKVINYLQPGEEITRLFDNQVDFEGESFWLFYSAPKGEQAGSRIYFAVSSNRESAVSSPGILDALILLSLKLDSISGLGASGISADQLNSFLDKARASRDSVENNLNTVLREQITSKYSELSFEEVYSSFDSLKASLVNAQSELESAKSSKSDFESYPSVLSFNSYLSSYNNSFNSFAKLSNDAMAYQKSVTAASNDLRTSGKVNDSVRRDALEALKAVYDVGDYASFKPVLASGRESFENSLKKASLQLNDSVQNTLYRMSYSDAAYYYSRLKDVVPSDFSAQKQEYYVACAINSTQLKSDWLSLQSLEGRLNSLSVAQLEEFNSLALKVQQGHDELAGKLTNCKTPAPTFTPPKTFDTSGINNILIAIAVLVLGYYGLNFYKQQKQKQDGEQADLEDPRSL